MVITVGDTRITKTGDQVTIKTPTALIEAERAEIKAGKVDLGGAGGKKIARIGDKTSDGATIVEGSGTVFAVD